MNKNFKKDDVVLHTYGETLTVLSPTGFITDKILYIPCVDNKTTRMGHYPVSQLEKVNIDRNNPWKELGESLTQWLALRATPIDDKEMVKFITEYSEMIGEKKFKLTAK